MILHFISTEYIKSSNRLSKISLLLLGLREMELDAILGSMSLRKDKIMLSKQLPHGEIIPRFYGISYQDYIRDRAICHPFPFNLLIGFFRPKWLMIRYGRVKWGTAVELKYQQKLHNTELLFYEKGMIAGHKDGYDRGFHDGVQKALSQVNQRVDIIEDVFVESSRDPNIDIMADEGMEQMRQEVFKRIKEKGILGKMNE